jgi:hypothetical protein
MLTAMPSTLHTTHAPAKSGVGFERPDSRGAQPRYAVFLRAEHGKPSFGWPCREGASPAGSLTRSFNPARSASLFERGVAGFKTSRGLLP